MLGIRRGTVELRPHSSEWSDLFKLEREKIRWTLRHLTPDVQHVGSTSVPGLAAKPVIDIAIGIPCIQDYKACIDPLEDIGYGYIDDRGERGGHIFDKGDEEVLTHTIHLVELGSQQWRNYLAFRDYLIADNQARNRYAQLKHSLSTRPNATLRTYTDGKASLIEKIIQEAVAYADQSQSSL